ncbi:MAG TPA: S-methyl-5-thioribose-1-phosphate isomerase [Gemmatimonadaceae bacterium]|jgi:methylthioribose-1-phosphate isomerase|nr:S-methyl-5-thioribose-1-phosphate isomerase [Gemmatimonadaceae bacterium]
MEHVRAVDWAPSGQAVRIIDQRRLPGAFVERDLATVDEVVEAIQTLAVRGAPAIGVAGALGLVAALLPWAHETPSAFLTRARAAAARIRSARPTAVNLPRAVDRLVAVLDQCHGVETPTVLEALRREATDVLEEDRIMCRQIGEWGAPLLHDGARVVTHCNAGALATSGMGTALAPVYVAAEAGRHIEVFAGETRPLLQGARLTAWELARAGVPVTVVPDGAVASLMRAGKVDLCIVGADRIAANGDAANKIGTYAVAVAARHHGIPFYVAAPTSTIDPEARTGADIPIEERARTELTAPDAAAVFNPAFDVTPAELISGIITDTGLYRPPYRFA